MPCYDPETHLRPQRLEAKVHRLTDLLCGLCTEVEKLLPGLLAENKELNHWWKHHKAQDARVAALKEFRKEFGREALSEEDRMTLMFADDISY